MQLKSAPHSVWTEAEAFRTHARRVLGATPSPRLFDPATGHARGPSDFDLDPELAHMLGPEAPRHAAVLVPVVARAPLTILLTQRTESLAKHAGQISFPGGKVDEDDADETAAALREAEEEIALSRGFVEPLGFLDSYRTGTGYLIHPVVALVQPGFSLVPNPVEVADTFEVPLAFLMDAANHQRHARVWQGRKRHFYAIPFGERFIWGATAGMLKNMHERFAEA
jgi:8-oxo-dGTP pyrophosphatase MutT (NUDIX family)